MYVRNFDQGSRWLSAIIEEVTGPVSYVVRLEDNQVMRQHADHIRRQATASSPTIVDATEEVDDLEDIPNSAVLPPADHAGDVTSSRSTDVNKQTPDVSSTGESPRAVEPTSVSPQMPSSVVVKSYPKRQVRPPDRFKPGQ